MALSNVTTGTGTTAQAAGGISTLATGTISPPSDCFLFITGCCDGDSTQTLTSVSTTLSNVGSWTIHNRRFSVFNGSEAFFAYALVTGSPGSGTITANISGTSTDAIVMLPGWLTGHNTSAPLAQAIVSGTGTSSTATATLGSTPSSSNEAIGVVVRFTSVNAAATITPGSGFTEAGQQFIWNGTWGFGLEAEVQYQNGGTIPTSITATALGTIDEWAAIAVEVAVASGGTVTGTAAVTLASPTSAASGAHGVAGSAAITAPGPTSAAAGVRGVTGTAAVTIAAPTSSATGTHLIPITGTAANTLAAPTSTAAGTATPPGVAGTAAVTLAAPTSSASGTATPPTVTGTAANTLAAPTSSATGTFTGSGVAGSAANTLPAPTSSAAGSTTVGSAAVTLPAPTSAATGAHGPAGTAAQTLAAPTSAATGAHGASGTSASAYSAPTSAANGTSLVAGTAANTLVGPSSSASGTHTPPGGTAPVVASLVVQFDGRQRVATGTLSLGQYVTTGKALTAASVGLVAITSMRILPAGTDATHAVVFEWIASTGKVQAFLGDSTNVAAAPLVEVPNLTDLTAAVASFRAIGY